MESKRITLVGLFGAGNLGNECTLQAVIERILQRWPQANLQCACANPEDVEARHNISAFYWKPVVTPLPDGIALGRRGLFRLFHIFRRIFCELAHSVTCLRTLSRSDLLIVCGTNIVSDYLTGPRGWPYDLFKWSALAALCRVRVLFLGIGVGPIYHPVSRWLIKRSLGFAEYRSYRDEASKQYMERIGFSTDRDAVCPDLVFGLSRRLFRSSDGARAGQRPVIGVGLKDYKNYEAESGADETNTYHDYLDIMVAFVCWLCEHGYNVRLLIGDVRHDLRATKDVLNTIEARFAERGQVVAEPALTVEELVRQLAETDLVISSRYHNLLLAVMLNKPVIALSDHQKLDSLMAELGLANYCQRLGNLDVGSLTRLFGRLQNDSERLKVWIRDKTEKYRGALDEQYASAFAKAERPRL
jgi:polysaccharide pyruvyl transferase WcaK-like protein